MSNSAVFAPADYAAAVLTSLAAQGAAKVGAKGASQTFWAVLAAPFIALAAEAHSSLAASSFLRAQGQDDAALASDTVAARAADEAGTLRAVLLDAAAVKFSPDVKPGSFLSKHKGYATCADYSASVLAAVVHGATMTDKDGELLSRPKLAAHVDATLRSRMAPADLVSLEAAEAVAAEEEATAKAQKMVKSSAVMMAALEALAALPVAELAAMVDFEQVVELVVAAGSAVLSAEIFRAEQDAAATAAAAAAAAAAAQAESAELATALELIRAAGGVKAAEKALKTA